MKRRATRLLLTVALVAVPLAAGARQPSSEPETLPVEELELPNGVSFLLVHRPGAPMTAAAWVVHAGSADEVEGETGIAHLIEHLMFKGSGVIGSRDPRREAPLLERRDELESELRSSPPGSSRRSELEVEVAQLDERLRALHMKGEFALVYTEAGAVGMNAITRRDLTLYYAMVPSPRLELWFWMESDRLAAPAFRELYDEYPVVEQEREQRIGAVPAGAQREAFTRAFWGERHPYSWPPAGLSEDLRGLTRPLALDWFEEHYRPSRLTAVLVGDFDREQVRSWAEVYFGRLPERSAEVAPAPANGASGERVALEVAEPVRQRDRCDCRPRVELRFHTVPFGDGDAVALDVVAGLLAGRTGRLHRSLVLDAGLAFSASALHAPLRRAGSFSVEAEARDGVDPARLEAALFEELARLREEPVGERELQKVKNQIATDSARQIKEPLAFGLRLLVYDALGDWRHLYRWADLAEAVTPQDMSRVARRYLTPERASVLTLERERSATASGAPSP